MLKISDLSQDEIELLKCKFDEFITDFKITIQKSKLFKNLTKENIYKKPNYHSLSHIEDKTKGLIIQWEDKFSSISIRIRTKFKGNEWKIDFFGNDGLINRFEYGQFDYYPLYLNEGKYPDLYLNRTFDTFQKKLVSGIFNITSEELDFIQLVNQNISNYLYSIREEIVSRQKNLIFKKDLLIKDLDRDSNGEVDLIDGDTFNKLLSKNQQKIIEVDKIYIQKFVKISNYIKLKRSNTQKIFDSIKEITNENELNELVNLLKNQIHTYELLVFHSINMVTSLVENDLITFYEIYECFDQLGVFNSNWENEVSNKLTDIGDGIKDLMYSIYQMENKIVNSIDNLSYITQESFRDLTFSVEKQLSSIDSTIKFNNLLTGIQTYQMYRINQNTKRIG